MEQLIKVTYENDQLLVSARELHDLLEVGTQYKDWFPRMCEYGFQEGVDFNLLKNERVQIEGGRQVKREVMDAAITIDMAKELCMLQRNEKGKQARQYFIRLEKYWNSPEKVMERALSLAQKAVAKLEAELKSLEPIKTYYDQILNSVDTLLTTQIAKDYGLSAKRLNKILHNANVQFKVNGQWVLYSYYDGKGYTESITHKFFYPDGSIGTSVQTKWTQKGRLMIHGILTKQGFKPVYDIENGL